MSGNLKNKEMKDIPATGIFLMFQTLTFDAAHAQN